MNYKDVAESAASNKKNLSDFYEILIENATEGIGIVDENGIIKYKSPAVERIMGYTLEEHLGTNTFDIIHPDDIPQAEKVNRELLKNPGKRIKSVFRFRHKSGKWIFLETVAVNLLNHPLIKGIMLNYRDVTERKTNNEQLQASEKRYRQMTELLPVGIFETDLNGKSIYVNKKWCEISGLSPKESVGDGWLKSVHPEDRDRVWKGWLHVVKNLEISEAEYRYLSPKGKITWVFGRAVAYRDERGNKKGFIGTTTDISKIKEMESSLVAKERFQETLIKNLPGIIYRCSHDKDWTLDFISSACYTLTGYHQKTFLQDKMGLARIIHPDDLDQVDKVVNKAIAKKKKFVLEYRIITSSGKTKWVWEQGSPIFDADEKFLFLEGYIMCITDRKAAEQKLRESENHSKAIVSGVPDMIFRVSSEGVYLDFKKATDFNPLIPPEIFIGKKIAETLPPVVARQAMKNLKKALSTKKVQSFVYSLQYKNEPSLNYFEARLAASGKDEVIVLVRDVTKNTEDEIALRKSEEKWRSLVKNAPNYIGLLDLDYNFTFINHLVSFKKEEMIGFSVNKFAAPEYKQELIKLLDEVTKRDKPGEMEFKTVLKDNSTKWLRGIFAPLKFSGKLEGIIAMAFDISDIKKGEEELKYSNKKLYELNERLESIREEEKKKIAMEIHDELGQELTAMKLNAFWLQQFLTERKLSEKDKSMLLKRVKTLIEISGNTINSVRKIAYHLRPVILDSLGLIPAIEWQVSYLNERTEVKCGFSSKIKDTVFNKEFSIAIFRIVQESLTNVVRHAKASKVDIRMFEKNNRIFLSISDDGKGISGHEINQPGKIGLFGIKERIKNWKGKFLIKGKKGKGTDIVVSFPISDVKL